MDPTFLSPDGMEQELEKSRFYAEHGLRPSAVLVRGHDHVWDVVTRLFREAQQKITSFDDPGRVTAHSSRLPQRVLQRCGDFQQQAIQRGVNVRQITSSSGLQHNEQVRCIQWGSGGEARLVAQVPYKMVVFDRRIAVIPQDRWILSDGLWLHRDPVVVQALTAAHQALWRGGAVPEAEDGEGPPRHLAPVLEALLAGTTDEVACRRLGLAPRTYSRRLAELLALLGVTSRFQAGAAACRRGWV